MVCFSCLYTLPKTNHLTLPDNAMAKNLWGRVPTVFCGAWLDFRKGGDVQQLMHLIKYKGKKELARFMGKQMAVAYKSVNQAVPDAIVAVPLHAKREAYRGYNQSYYLALGLQEIFDVPIIHQNLIRSSSNASQTRKNRYERYINVKEKFEIKHPEAFENKMVMLVDDVFTTGATVEACLQCLTDCAHTRTMVYTLAFTR